MPAITHQVFFKLGHAPGSKAERQFLDTSVAILAGIPGVEDFQVLRQVSRTCDFTFGFSMTFADQRAYDAYDAHPDHQAYVAEIWPEVAAFQEIDSVFEDV